MQQTNPTATPQPLVTPLESPGLKAVRAFRNPPHRLNCAQAVAHAWASDDAAASAAVAAHAKHGGGNTPDGECGALFAARQIATRRGGDPETLRRRFAAVHGHTTCRELRARRVACAECVRTAADLVKGVP